MINFKKIVPFLLIGAVLIAVFTVALFSANYIQNSPDAQSFIAQLGYFGVVIIAIISGLNAIVPIPGVAFTPIFSAAGLWLPGIILSLTIGTLIADIIGFQFGNWSRDHIYKHYPRAITFFENIHTDKPHLTWSVVFIYVAFLPFPNEVMLIPLAFLKIKLRTILLPLLLGNLVHQTIYALGVQSIYNWMF